jgi:hypothetical protein
MGATESARGMFVRRKALLRAISQSIRLLDCNSFSAMGPSADPRTLTGGFIVKKGSNARSMTSGAYPAKKAGRKVKRAMHERKAETVMGEAS